MKSWVWLLVLALFVLKQANAEPKRESLSQVEKQKIFNTCYGDSSHDQMDKAASKCLYDEAMSNHNFKMSLTANEWEEISAGARTSANTNVNQLPDTAQPVYSYTDDLNAQAKRDKEAPWWQKLKGN